MRSRRAVRLLALPILAGAIAWWAARRPDAEGPTPEVLEAPSREAAAPLLAANDREAAEGYRVEDGVAVPRERVSDATGPGVVVVRVVDERGHPVPGRTVRGVLEGYVSVTPTRPLDPTSRYVAETLRSRRSDASGIARWTGLRENLNVHVRIVAEERWSTAETYVGVGSPLVTLRITPLAPFEVHVTDEDGRGVPKALVAFLGPFPAGANVSVPTRRGRRRLELSFSGEAYACADAQGRATLSIRPDVEAGGLWVEAEGFAPWFEAAWRPGDTEVRLERAREIEGIVRDTKGAVVTDGVVAWETAQGIRGEAEVAYDGTFSVEEAPSGPLRLEWRLADAPSLDGLNVQHVAAGRGPVTFVVSLGARLSVRVEGWPREAGGVAWLTPQDDARPDPARQRADVDLEGNAHFDGVTPDRPYVLWVPPADPPRSATLEARRTDVVYRRDVVVSDETLVVRLEAGRTVRGVVDLAGTGGDAPVGPDGPWCESSVSVLATGMECAGEVAWRLADASGLHLAARELTFRVDGVPAGESRLVARLSVLRNGADRMTRWIGEAPVPDADEPVRLRLRPAPEPSAGDR